jgi:large subunit ribosomal protein L24
MNQPKSKKPKKQRKFLHQAPLHLRRKMLAAHLSKELREKYKRRSMPVRKGDEVQVMRGKFKGKTGKISRVNLKKYKVYIEGIKKKRTVGTEYQVPFHPSKLRIISLNLVDKKRIKILERKGVKIG